MPAVARTRTQFVPGLPAVTPENAAIAGFTDSGAMHTLHPRGKFRAESPYDEHKKYDGSLALLSVYTFLHQEHGGERHRD